MNVWRQQVIAEEHSSGGLPTSGRPSGQKAPFLALPETWCLIMTGQDSILAGGLLFLAFPWDLQKSPENNLQSDLITF